MVSKITLVLLVGILDHCRLPFFFISSHRLPNSVHSPECLSAEKHFDSKVFLKHNTMTLVRSEHEILIWSPVYFSFDYCITHLNSDVLN